MKNENETPLDSDDNQPQFPPCGLTILKLLGLIGIGYVLIPLVVEYILLRGIKLTPSPVVMVIEQAATVVYWVCLFRVFKKRYQEDWSFFLNIETDRSVLNYFWNAIKIFFHIMVFAILYNLIIQMLGLSQASPYKDFSREELQVIACLAVLVAPFVEEFIFRGAMLSLLLNKTSSVKAVIVSGIIFTAFHGWYLQYPSAIGFVFGLSLIFGFARLRNQSIIPGVFAHGVNNALAAWMAINAPQLLDSESVKQAVILFLPFN